MDWLDKLPGFWKQAVPDGYARASHILFLRIDPDAESKADAVLARLTAGTISFPAAALEYSCCPTRDQTPAGDLATFSSLSAMANVDEMRSFEGTLTLPCASAGDRTQHRYVRAHLASETLASRCVRADEGLDTTPFDDAVFAAPIGVPQKVESQWGWHLLLVTERGNGPRAINAPSTKVDLGELKVKVKAPEVEDAGKSL